MIEPQVVNVESVEQPVEEKAPETVAVVEEVKVEQVENTEQNSSSEVVETPVEPKIKGKSRRRKASKKVAEKLKNLQ